MFSDNLNKQETLFLIENLNYITVMILSFRTDRGAVWSGSTLFAIPSASFECITLRWSHFVQILGWLQQMFRVSKFLGFLQYFQI